MSAFDPKRTFGRGAGNMTQEGNLRADFETAMGEEFGALVSPPVPFLEASPHECCEAIWLAFGHDVTPRKLASVSDSEIADLANAFGTHFECDAPARMQLREAIARTLARWPPGSLDE
jgi:hypothetical protein